jgi:hypothetical protein
MKRFLCLSFIPFACILFAIGMAFGDDKPNDSREPIKVPELSAQESHAQMIIEYHGSAYRLAELGDQQLAPELLLAAAIQFRKVRKAAMQKLAEKPTIELGRDAKKDDKLIDEEAKAPDYDKEADTMMERAEACALFSKIDLTKLIKAMKERPISNCVEPGPRQVSRVIGSQQWHTYRIEVEPYKSFALGLRAQPLLRVEVSRSDTGHVFVAGAYPYASLVFSPGAAPQDKKTVPITIRLLNETKVAQDYHLLLQ